MSPYSILALLVVIALAGWYGWDFLSANREDAELLAWLAGPIAVLFAGLAVVKWPTRVMQIKSPKPRRLPPHYQMLLQSVRNNEEHNEAVLQEVKKDLPRTLQEYRLYCVARHALTQQRVDRRFVRLSLLMDRRWESDGSQGWTPEEKEQPFKDLREVIEARPNDQALVLLGAPGCGKSTLLRRLEYDRAVEALQQDDADAALTWEIPLNAHNAELLPPGAWLSNRWKIAYPDLPPLDEMLSKGICLLLDGLNELSHQTQEEYSQRVAAWRQWLQGLPANVRVLFSCRSLNYSESLSSERLTVPHVRFLELDNEQVKEFLKTHLPQQWELLWDNLKDSRRLEMERTPFFLRMEADQYRERGGPPDGPAELFSGFVWQALSREMVKENPVLKQNQLLSQRDRERINAPAIRRTDPHRLPEEGSLLPGLTRLAYQIQRATGGAANAPVRYAQALELIGVTDAAQVMAAGDALRLLDENRQSDEVFFVHSLFKEYFAARQLAKTPDYSLLHLPWRTSEVQSPLRSEIDSLKHYEPLKIPVSEWQETALLAAALAENPEAFIQTMIPVNLPLAGLCAAQPGVSLAADRRRDLAERLIERSRDPRADLRARIAAGLALGELGDPRLERRQGPHGEFLLPPRVLIPGGSYRLGGEAGEGEQNEFPPFDISLEAFELAQFPVTNAEWRWFMLAGGYDNPEWWETEEAQAWRQGKLSMEPERKIWRGFRQRLQQDFAGATAGFTQIQVEQCQGWVDADDETFETELSKWFPEGEVMSEPAYWLDSRFNNPAQPVVGVSWYEARAYCRWLSDQTGRHFSLPGEAQWEAACRGRERRTFAWAGEYDPMKANVYETHLRATTPVGVFPLGDTPEGVMDMTGNVWEWTRDRFESYRIRPDDERDEAAGRHRRVLRGGSFNNDRRNVRAAYRSYFDPAFRSGNIGFRVSCELSPIPDADR